MAPEPRAQALSLAPALTESVIYRPSEQRLFQESIVLVPFFGAKSYSLNKHMSFLNELGYDCYLVLLKDSFQFEISNYFNSKLDFGKKAIWAEQIEKVLNQVPGSKILFSFSNPSGSAIEAISRRHCVDIKGLICDGGPSEELLHSFENYFENELSIKNSLLKYTGALFVSYAWGSGFAESIHANLNHFTSGFKILSIRGFKDKLVTPSMIDQIFDPHPQIDWRKLSLPQGGHLNGLKDFPKEYKTAVAEFLTDCSEKISASSN
jgi:hypothetical protein